MAHDEFIQHESGLQVRFDGNKVTVKTPDGKTRQLGQAMFQALDIRLTQPPRASWKDAALRYTARRVFSHALTTAQSGQLGIEPPEELRVTSGAYIQALHNANKKLRGVNFTKRK